MRYRSATELFPFGKGALILLISTFVASVYLLFHPVPKNDATLRYWTFTHISYQANQKALPEFERTHPGVTVDLQLVHITAVTSRLRAAFWADLDVPDIVEVEISRAGSFFRGPVDDVGFLDLTPFIERDHLFDRMVRSRFAAYTNRGHVFGMPLDIHPVMLAYRRDLVEEAGVDVNSIDTWDDFVRVGRQLTRPGERYMIQMSSSGAGELEMMLFQRGGGYFDRDGNLIMDNALAVDTLKFYVRMVAGSNRIANELGSGSVLTQAVEEGYFLFYVCPDWYSFVLQNDVPRMKGKMAFMPLPAWEPGGRRTSTLGGTMLGITKHCENPELAWEFATYLFHDRGRLAERFRKTNIIPPLKDAWDDPVYDEPRPYWSNQAIGRMYINLADQVPPQYTSPFIEIAKTKMNGALAACAAYYNKHGEEGFDEYARTRLKEAADEVRVFMKRESF